MKKIMGDTLEQALLKAANEFGCSVTEIEYEIAQYDSKGFLGIGKKQAIIIANMKLLESVGTDLNNTTSVVKKEDEFFDASEFIQDKENQEDKADDISVKKFQTKEEIVEEITMQIKELLSHMPYKIDKVSVSFLDAQLLYIFLDGEDSALLIGERGYRYKALSYLFFNWIQPAYGYNIRLEIAEFFRNQEQAVNSYLVGIINQVKTEGKAQTKPLDGILAFIALKKLREHFPDKYISLRQNTQNDNERYIVINDFSR